MYKAYIGILKVKGLRIYASTSYRTNFKSSVCKARPGTSTGPGYWWHRSCVISGSVALILTSRSLAPIKKFHGKFHCIFESSLRFMQSAQLNSATHEPPENNFN